MGTTEYYPYRAVEVHSGQSNVVFSRFVILMSLSTSLSRRPEGQLRAATPQAHAPGARPGASAR